MTSKENTPLKVTPEHIEQLIQSEHYFTAYDASHGDTSSLFTIQKQISTKVMSR